MEHTLFASDRQIIQVADIRHKLTQSSKFLPLYTSTIKSERKDLFSQNMTNLFKIIQMYVLIFVIKSDAKDIDFQK